LITCLYPALALLAEGGDVSFFKNPAIWRPLNAILFLLIIIYILRKKIGIGGKFDSRAAAIRKELEEARIEKQRALDRLEEIESRLNSLDEEVAEIRVEAQREAEREAGRIREAALADAAKIEQLARREIDGAMRTARAELRAFVAEQSVELAQSIVRREIRPDDDRRIISQFIDDLREAGK
jgi:F0F1-type ATP synthase membrane subunit b/b'